MGAGNPIVRSYDNDRIDINTFFVDLSDDRDIDEYIADYEKDNDGDTISKEIAYQDIDDQAYEAFMQMFYVKGLEVHGWVGDRVDELSAEVRGDGIIIATGDNISIVVPSGCYSYHIGFGFIPKISWETLWEEAWDENADKQKWYAARNWNFDGRMNLIADREFSKHIRKCNAEIKKVAANIAKEWGTKTFPKIFSVRAGAWTSRQINKTEFKRLAVI